MEKVFHFDTPREQYTADAAVVMCFDLRFNLAFHKFLKKIGAPNYDLIKVAGGAKCLASPENNAEREFVLEQVRKSIRLHQTKRIVLMVHSDCGAYGGSNAFDTSAAESRHHEDELRHAAAVLREVISEVTIEAYFVDFEGVWSVDLAPVTISAAK